MPLLQLREPPGILGQIAARARADVARRATSSPPPRLDEASAAPRPSFTDALAAPGLSLIAELKPRAPSGGILRDRDAVEPWVRLVAPRASALSVLCDEPFFGGGFDLLARARAAAPTTPLLCKDFVVDERQLLEAIAAGAAAVLLIVALLPPPTLRHLRARAGELGLATLVEVHDAEELREAIGEGAPIIGVNSRDLRTLATDLGAAAELLAAIPPGHLRVAESGLHEAADVDRIRAVADAVLVGTALSRAADPVAVIDALRLAGAS